MNGWDILVILLIAGAVLLAVRVIRKSRREGKNCYGCSGGCAGCGMECPKKDSSGTGKM